MARADAFEGRPRHAVLLLPALGSAHAIRRPSRAVIMYAEDYDHDYLAGLVLLLTLSALVEIFMLVLCVIARRRRRREESRKLVPIVHDCADCHDDAITAGSTSTGDSDV